MSPLGGCIWWGRRREEQTDQSKRTIAFAFAFAFDSRPDMLGTTQVILVGTVLYLGGYSRSYSA